MLARRRRVPARPALPLSFTEVQTKPTTVEEQEEFGNTRENRVRLSQTEAFDAGLERKPRRRGRGRRARAVRRFRGGSPHACRKREDRCV